MIYSKTIIIIFFLYFILITLFIFGRRKIIENYNPTELTASQITPATSCAKDENCFNTIFTCDSCCKTGKTSDGTNCWDGYYTKETCCNKLNDFDFDPLYNPLLPRPKD